MWEEGGGEISNEEELQMRKEKRRWDLKGRRDLTS